MKVRNVLIVVLAVAGLMGTSVSANLILNPGFEEGVVDGKEYGQGFTDSYPIDPPNYLYNWKLSSGGSGWSGYYAHESYRCIYTTGIYIYAYQESIDVTGGADYTLGAWCRPMKDGTNPWPTGIGAMLEIIWFPVGVEATMANYSQKISRQTAATYVPVEGEYNTYNYFEGTLTAPANAGGAMVLVGNKTASGWTYGYFDDVSLVPEPATIGLLLLGLVGLVRRR